MYNFLIVFFSNRGNIIIYNNKLNCDVERWIDIRFIIL